ncbi:MAG: hypothetical protein LUF26_07945, partial [Firmicutes bacterium]|nr:hypothetical protein [Bacillota bacterium]
IIALKDFMLFEEGQQDINAILCFIEKNKEIINCKQAHTEAPPVKVEFHGQRKKIIDELLKAKRPVELIENIRKSYNNNEIMPHEIQNIIKQYDKNRIENAENDINYKE